MLAVFAAFSLALPSECSPGLNWVCWYTPKGIVSIASQTCVQTSSADIIFNGSFCPPKTGYYTFWMNGTSTTWPGTALMVNDTTVDAQNTIINVSLSNKLCYPLRSDIPQTESVTSTIYYQYNSGDVKIVTSDVSSSCYSYFCKNSLSPPYCSPNSTSKFTVRNNVAAVHLFMFAVISIIAE